MVAHTYRPRYNAGPLSAIAMVRMIGLERLVVRSADRRNAVHLLAELGVQPVQLAIELRQYAVHFRCEAVSIRRSQLVS